MGAIISVFGGSQPMPGDPVYQDALHLGSLLAKGGFIVQTGGYIGTMEALSRGASEAGGHVIGVTCDQIESWRPVKVNQWVSQEVHFNSFQERIFNLVENCDAFLALPGGVGTLVEITLAWNLLITQILPPRPIILIGSGWRSTFETFLTGQDKFIPENQRKWISYAPDVDFAFQQLQELLSKQKPLQQGINHDRR